jgi:hypothetical protein
MNPIFHIPLILINIYINLLRHWRDSVFRVFTKVQNIFWALRFLEYVAHELPHKGHFKQKKLKTAYVVEYQSTHFPFSTYLI